MPLDERSRHQWIGFSCGRYLSQSLAHDIDLTAHVKYLEARTVTLKDAYDLTDNLREIQRTGYLVTQRELTSRRSYHTVISSASITRLTSVKIKEFSTAITVAVSHTWRNNPRTISSKIGESVVSEGNCTCIGNSRISPLTATLRRLR